MSDLQEKCAVVLQALNDWAVTYAPDMCNPETVIQAVDRTHQHGTLAYIANAYEKMREVIAALSEAEHREKDARRVVLGEAAEAIFVMGAWHPNYEKITPNTFDEGTSAAYEIIRELQGKAGRAALERIEG